MGFLGDSTLLLELARRLGDPWGDDFEKELDDQFSLILEERLEVLLDSFARRIALDPDRQDVLFDRSDRRLSYQFFVLLSEHDLDLLFQLGELLQVLVDAHDLLVLKRQES